MEGKKYRALCRDCRAVSEVIGQVLMVAIVVLAFSSIALTVFSDEGAMRPPHVPRTDLQESIVGNETVKIYHSGGEVIDLKDVKIIIGADGKQAEFDMSDPAIYGSAVTVFDPRGNQLSPGDVFMLGDYILIDLSSETIITGNSTTELYFVHTASSQVIKKALL